MRVADDGGDTGSAGGAAEPMEDEFGTMARWTHEAVRELGPAHAVPAACRGSGTPAVLDWLLERVAPGATGHMLDVGSGLGGPAAYAKERLGVRPVCVEPERDASVAAADLFALPAVIADAARLPFPDAAFDAAWSLGTLCTTDEKARWLAELRRVLRRRAPLGLLVVVSTEEAFSTSGGNTFPSDGGLAVLLADAGFDVLDRAWSSDLPDADEAWTRAEQEVDAVIAARHGADPRYARAKEQEADLAALLDEGRIRGRLLVARARHERGRS